MSKYLRFGVAMGAALAACASCGIAENMQPRQLVREVIQNELRADSNDHSHWIYRDRKKTPEKSAVTIVIETSQGSVKKTVEIDGRPLTAEQRRQDEAKMESLVHDPAARQKQHQDGEHDDQQARALMKMLPDAFIWTEVSQRNGAVTLDFKPNPQFKPPTRAARVFAAMAGKMVVDQQQKRLKSLSGVLTAPVNFGFGLLGKLQEGGTFGIERQQVAPREWQITATHVHIRGKALLFKSIDEQEEEETSGYKPAPPSLTLAQAAKMLNSGKGEEEISER